mgnify:CR=1 FL=1
MQTSYPNIRDGRLALAVAGTPQKLVTTNTPCKKVEITAFTGNTGFIAIGDKTVVVATATRRGTPLMAGQTLTLYISDLSVVYADAEVAGEGVTFLYFL